MDVTTHELPVPGAKLYYELRGSGPLMLLIGCPMEAMFFGAMADALGADHTVVTYDPRGISHSIVDDLDAPVTPDVHAGDLHAVIAAVGDGPADVFGSSGGAVNGLALAARHPEDVRTLVAHEPPLSCFLPDAADVDAGVDAIVGTYRTDGAGAAFGRFLALCGFDLPDGEAPPMPPNPYQEQNDRHFFLNLIRPTTRYRPDADALRKAGPRVVIGAGADSGRQLAARTARATAAAIGVPLVEFAGDHGGFLGEPEPFLATLRGVLA
ncbi:MAG: alpha/beta hydrolase [Acidothermales bacterium]|nr:alpha/beta hydrolase [Acidothermales bacterium]